MDIKRFSEKTALFVLVNAAEGELTVFLDTDDGRYRAIMRKGSPVEIRAGYRPEGQPAKYAALEDLPDDAEVVKMVHVCEKTDVAVLALVELLSMKGEGSEEE